MNMAGKPFDHEVYVIMLTRLARCIIVDSTRRGKRIPDSLAKTIPIWCSTINLAVHKYRLANGLHIQSEPMDIEFHSLPSVVSQSEHAQIEERIDAFAERLLVRKLITLD